ncbi:MAG: hypothetical protein ACI8TQ_000279 [Planctomycetota bacterium]|jgi:hypothetical protein
MKLITLFFLAALSFGFANVTPISPTLLDIKADYHGLAAAGSQAELVELWKANEAMVLSTIDQDLEGSLALWEEAQLTNPGQPLSAEAAQKVAELSERALFGAQAASLAFDRPIFSDYASAFLSWTPDNKRDFRAGQAAFGEAVKAIRAGEFETTREQGERCTELALPLGDWWGAAMGLGISGAAYLELDSPEKALGNLSQARLLNQALGLKGSELRNLDAMLGCLEKLGHKPRAAQVCRTLVASTDGEQRAEYESRLAELTK